MIHLILREMRRLMKSPVPWILLVITTLAAVIAWQNVSSEESRSIKEQMDPIARYRLMLREDAQLRQKEEALITIDEELKDPDLTVEERIFLEERKRSQQILISGGFLMEMYQERYSVISRPDSIWTLTTEPEHVEEFEKVQELMTTARDENFKKRVFPYVDHGLDFSAYTLRLFAFSQSGFLILSALILGVMSAGIQENPLIRKIGSWQILISRIGALMLFGILALILPRIIASVIMGLQNGWGYTDLTIPFNPRAGYPLFLAFEEEASLRYALTSSIRADSLFTLRQAFILMYAYETAQLMLWLCIGLLSGSLTGRRFLQFGIPAAIFLTGRIAAPLSQSQFSGLLFPLYNDAVRDVIGGGNMLTGFMIQEIPPQDFATGIAVMTLTGLAALYLTDLKQKLTALREEKGDAHETL